MWEVCVSWFFILFGKHPGSFTARKQRDAAGMVWVFWRWVWCWIIWLFVEDPTYHHPGWRMKEHPDNTLTPWVSDQCMLMSEVSYGIYPTSLSWAFWRWKWFCVQTLVQAVLYLWEVLFTCSTYFILHMYLLILPPVYQITCFTHSGPCQTSLGLWSSRNCWEIKLSQI